MDKEVREDFIRLFDVDRVETDVDEESPFYNYQFYILSFH